MKLTAESPLLILSFLSITQSRSITTQRLVPALSDNAISTKFSDWLSAFNSADEATIQDFYTTSFNSSIDDPEEANMTLPSGVFSQPNQWTWMANWTGGFEVVDIEPEFGYSDTSIAVLLQQKNRKGYPGYFRAKMVIDDQEPGQPITKLDLYPVSTPLKMIPMSHPNRTLYEKGLQPLTPALREKLVANIVKVLREQYIDLQQAEERIVILEENLRNGEYDDMIDSNDFHMHLSSDLANISEINEWRKFGNPFISYQEPWELREPMDEEEWEERYIQMGYGFGNVSFDADALPGKIVATLPITHLFSIRNPKVLEAASKAMNSVADTDVLILDLRYCSGNADTAAFVLSFLFDEQLPLLKLLDRDGKVQNVTQTMSVEELRASGAIQDNYFGGKKPVYVLTNNNTMIYAELIAYTVQVYGRGVVVGESEATFGWAHPTDTRFGLCEEEFGEGWWDMYLQTLTMVHEATGKNWEQGGVKSDVVVEETVQEEHCQHKARLAAIEIERKKGLVVQDELR